MKLKYYLRGLGLGIVLTAILMGVTLGRNTSKMSDEEIIKRAKQLGMVEAESTLSSYSETAKGSEADDEVNNIAPDSELDQKREEVSEEVHENESATDESVPEMDEASKEGEETGESSESIESEEDVKLASDDAAETASTDTVEAEKTETVSDDTLTETYIDNTKQPETEESVKNNEQADNAQQDTAKAQEAPQAAQSNDAATVQTGAGDSSYVVVVLPSGSDSDDCARILREAGVISDGVEYNNYLISTGKDRLIRSGTKQIPRGASFEEITSIITR